MVEGRLPLPDEKPGTAPPVPLRVLLPILAVIGATSLGGGRFAYYYDAFVQKRGWLTSDQFVESLTVSQVLPGPTFANLTIFLSQRLGGIWAALGGFIVGLAPGAAAMILLSHLYLLGTSEIPVVDNAFRAVGVAASALTLVTVLRLVRTRSGVPNRSALAIAAVTFLALGPFAVSAFIVVPPLVLLGLWLNRPGRERKHG